MGCRQGLSVAPRFLREWLISRTSRSRVCNFLVKLPTRKEVRHPRRIGLRLATIDANDPLRLRRSVSPRIWLGHIRGTERPLFLLLGGTLRFSTPGRPGTPGTCYVALWHLPRPDLHQLADGDFQDIPTAD
jgi:hypothetical protein